MASTRVAIYFKNSLTGKEPVKEWLESLKDKVGQANIYVRIARAQVGNFGDHRFIGGGVMELRIAIGPGYRLYYALHGSNIILLLVGGDKSTQKRDIVLAKKYWTYHLHESKED